MKSSVLSRLERLESQLGDSRPRPHTHPLRIVVIDDDGPDAAYRAERAACNGCERPNAIRVVCWPPELW